jgi:predicted ribosome-associated RNA-binding protein Tma20
MLEGSLVSVVAQGSAEVVAIGQLAASKQELVADRKGKAVLTVRILTPS